MIARGSPRAGADVARLVGRFTRDREALSRQWRSAEPFPHLVIDDVLDASFCRRLCAQFGECDPHRRGPEYGGLFGIQRGELLSWGPAYRRIDALLRPQAVRQALAAVTGAAPLLYDGGYIGRGPSAHAVGRGVPPHVDFNRHYVTDWARALNLILYLNDEWDSEWGGHTQLYACRDAGRLSLAKTVAPAMNRLLLFEPGQVSWHGVSRVALPEGKRHLTRRALLVSYWTDDPTVAEHPTVWAGPACAAP